MAASRMDRVRPDLTVLARGLILLAFTVAPTAAVQAQAPPAAPNPSVASAAPAQTAPSADSSQILDSVVAIVNGEVLLQSDVDEEERFEQLQSLPQSRSGAAFAARRLISRTLILAVMKAQGLDDLEVPDADVEKAIGALRKALPGCAEGRCADAAGWASFLAARGLTPDEVTAHWRQRLQILAYLNRRFRESIRIPAADVAAYYNKTLVPQLEKAHAAAPPLKTVAPRIQEILLQQQVNGQIGDWLKTLRQEGNVKILVPAYGESSSGGDEDDTGGGA